VTIDAPTERHPGIEMTGDPRFRGRVRRLAVTSGVALGVTWTLAVGTLDAPPWIDILLLAGWLSMLTVLTLSLARPSIRRLVVVPSVMVTAALIGICLWELPPSGLARAGWLTLTAGILMGGGMGAWFWYRWVPVPRALDDPYASGRTILIAAHVGLVVGGTVLILVGQVV
jgi:hypothetical protein